MNLLRTIHSQNLRDNMPSVLPNLTPIKKLPFQRVYQPDEIPSKAYTDMKIISFQEVNKNLMKWLDESYKFSSFNDHVVYYKIEVNESSILKVFECIRVDDKFHVQLFQNGSPIPLPQWATVMVPLLKSWERFAWKRNRNILLLSPARHSCSDTHHYQMLHYMLLKQFNLPLIYLLSKLKQGSINSNKRVKILNESGNISEEVILMFLQRSEEFVGGNLIGSDDSGALYKWIESFRIVGLKSNVPHIIRAVPETKVTSIWLKGEI